MRFDWIGFAGFVNKTQKQLASIVGVQQGQISKLSKSGNIKNDVFVKLTEEFGKDVVDRFVTSVIEYETKAPCVPLVPIYALGGKFNDFVASIHEYDCEKIISPIKDVNFAIQVAGDSMAPEFPNGCIVFVQRIKESAFIEWGKAYVLATANGNVVKLLTPSNKKGCVRCISINPDPKYAPFDVSMSDIYGIYRIKLCMSIK